MSFAEMLCHVAKLRFAGDAQVGARVSPVVISPREATEIVDAARRLLPANTYVAVACPGVEPWEDERTCVAEGERAAERATYWRNHVAPELGDRILYVSARRLGRAGGLQDTLFDLSEQRLRAGFLEWCQDPACGLPHAVARALVESGVADLADARSLVDYASAVLSASDPMEAAGWELPRLSLARDTALGAMPIERLRENVRWTRRAAAGDTRGSTRLSDHAASSYRALAAATSSGGDLAASLGSVDLGGLSLQDLAAPPPKPRSPVRQAIARPARAADPAESSSRPKGREAPPRRGEPSLGGGTSASAVASSDPRPAATPPSGPSGAITGAPLEGRAGLSLDGVDVGLASLSGGEGETVRDDGVGGKARPALDLQASRDPEGERADAATRPISPPERGRPTRAPSAPLPEPARTARVWPRATGPSGVMDLLLRSVGGPLAGLVWRIPGSDPGQIFVKAPRALGDPDDEVAPLAGLSGAVYAWETARARLIEAAGGAEAALIELVQDPFTALGSPDVAALASEVTAAARAALEAAASMGPDALRWALNLDTVAVRSASRGSVVALSPLHPLYLDQILERLPSASELTRAKDLKRALITRWLDRPLRCPGRWPSLDGALHAAPLAPRLLAYGSAPRALSGDEIESASHDVVRRFLAMTPAAALGLRVLIDADEVDPAVMGVARAVSGDVGVALTRVWVHAAKPPSSAVGLDDMVRSGRLTLSPRPLAGERPHVVLRVRHGIARGSSEDPGRASSYARFAGEAGAGDAELVDVGGGGVSLSAIHPEPSADEAAWDALIAPAIRGAIPRGSFALVREARPGVEVSVVTRDLRGAARELVGALGQLGVADTRPKTARSLTSALAANASGVLTLSGRPERQVAALLLERSLLDALGDDAVVAHLTGAEIPLWFGSEPGEWGAFAIGAALERGRLAVCVGYGAITGELGADDLAAALRRAASVVEATADEGLGGYARGVVQSALDRAIGRVDELARPVATGDAPVISFACVLPPAHPWAGGWRVASRPVAVSAADPALLERVMMSAGRRRG